MKYKLFDGGYLPERAHFDDAGIDLRTPVPFLLKAHSSATIDLAIGFEIPIGYFGKLESKSGLNIKNNIQSAGGVIDSSFRGSIIARIDNNSDKDYLFEAGDKVVQMVLIPVGLFTLEETSDLAPDFSGRGKNGYGSTGK